MHGLPFFSLKKANKNLYEKLPPNLKIAKLSVSYSNYFCFVAFLQSHTFAIFNSSQMQSERTRQARLDSLTYFQVLLSETSLI